MPLIIKWNKRAINQLIKAIEYIEKDSVQNAEKVKNDLLTEISKLIANPERYNPDKYHLNNDGSFRAFELHSYRVSYRYTKNEIRIIRIRHTRRNPKNY
ncbi:MAG: type II toxin-antitoxin system RelE/ParE family toxin [Ferruginibacter sp.]|nr:type II toxin-antitoxin system RelE/ParE family toxin [Chitinophagaceae bacterium]